MGCSKKLFWGFLGVFFLAIIGCTTLPNEVKPGRVELTKSKFDNSTHIHMEPACLDSSIARLGLYRNSKMPENEIVLIVVVKGAHLFAPKGSLKFIIDWNEVVFSSIDKLKEIEISEGIYGSDIYISPVNWTSEHYLIDRSFLERILNANQVAVRIDLKSKYILGAFSKDAPTLARPGFRKFFQAISE